MKKIKKQKIAMLISGGVDSSVALALLKNAGHDAHAFYLKIWLEDEVSFLGTCPWEEDLRFVRAVCEQFDVPLEVVPFQKAYWEGIVSYVLHEVRHGRTPNPDMLCNARVKFGAFYEYISRQNFDAIATGHYARTRVVRGKTRLLCSPDKVKDQTYFLSQLSGEQLLRAMFPIGKYTKEEVRKLAEKFNLPNASRKDSQGICFLGKVAFDAFLRHYLGVRRGNIIDIETKKKIGEHDGFWFFTIGQRHGIKLSGGPWYVVEKDTKENIVYVSNIWRSDVHTRDTFIVANMNWISSTPPRKRMFSVKIRHGEHLYACRVCSFGEGRWQVKLLNHADAGIAPGQFAVLYDGEECLGGGTISEP